MEPAFEQLKIGKLLTAECHLCHLTKQVFQREDTSKKTCIDCILERCNYYAEEMPCMNCVVYGFYDREELGYKGEHDGLCANCKDYIEGDIDLIKSMPTKEHHEYVLNGLRNYFLDCDCSDE